MVSGFARRFRAELMGYDQRQQTSAAADRPALRQQGQGQAVGPPGDCSREPWRRLERAEGRHPVRKRLVRQGRHLSGGKIGNRVDGRGRRLEMRGMTTVQHDRPHRRRDHPFGERRLRFGAIWIVPPLHNQHGDMNVSEFTGQIETLPECRVEPGPLQPLNAMSGFAWCRASRWRSGPLASSARSDGCSRARDVFHEEMKRHQRQPANPRISPAGIDRRDPAPSEWPTRMPARIAATSRIAGST